MPLAPNALLQANASAASKTSSVNNSAKAADNGGDDRSSFSDVYAKQAEAKSAARDDAPVKSRSAVEKDRQVADKSAAKSTDGTPATEQSTVADSGNTLPVDPDAGVAAVSEDASAADDQVVDPALLQAQTPELPVDPTLDPALQAMAAQAIPVPVVAKPVVEATPEQPVALAATAAPSIALPTGANDPVAEVPFDPDADPLEGLPALQFALESAAAKAQQAQNASNSGKAVKGGEQTTDQTQNLANNLAALDDQLPVVDVDKDNTESSDKSFGALLDDGLKDVKTAAGDTRMDNFSDRLAAMSQAAQHARAAVTPSVPVINQPLAMHQSGWSEGVVDRVMYLSAQNLKSADIQLEPAELGRLDIRINMAPDQQTQVTFMSAHIGVREALESQMSRLRESFTQQGLGQVDVNVSDQSRNQQGQPQEQASNTRGTGNNGSGNNGVEGSAEGGSLDSAVAVSQPAARVIGSSEIDYYA